MRASCTLCHLYQKVRRLVMSESDLYKKFREKKFKNFGAEVYDFTIYKLESLLYDLYMKSADDLDYYIFLNILDMYEHGEVEVEWIEGYPMAMPID
jgi:hypothetical protein